LRSKAEVEENRTGDASRDDRTGNVKPIATVERQDPRLEPAQGPWSKGDPRTEVEKPR